MGNKIVVTVTYVANVIHTKTHQALDFISFHVCPSRPSHKLATDNLHIPAEDLSVLAEIFNLIRDALGLVIIPFQSLNDKKFTVHIFETATVFLSPNNPQVQNVTPTCEKVLMYIAQHKNKIVEPVNKQIKKTVSLNGNDYEIPVNFWYTFNIDNNNQIYFFAHVSVVANYKGVIIAVSNDKEPALTKMKNEALDYYNQNLGMPNINYIPNKQMNFI